MRTTVRLDPEVAAAARELSRTRHMSLSQAVNSLAVAGLEHSRGPMRAAFKQPVERMGAMMIDVSKVAEALDLLEGPDAPR
ncbi:MAG: hypothetical protein LBG60_06765 [Bifidobacteriaceae bacterium]|jgi:hypothetical protein|nr:hypothetical protein [Bifidobacteriaceae bacterium]